MATHSHDYVTCTVSVLKGDGIVIHVLNSHNTPEHVRMVIHMNTGAGAKVISDSGQYALPATWQGGTAFTVAESGEYWVRISASSEFVVPKVSFERLSSGVFVPVVSYLPGDFAVFRTSSERLF